MDLGDRFREALLPRSSNHQLGCSKPAVAVLLTDLGFINAAGEGPR
jgi:hypothetical protein